MRATTCWLLMLIPAVPIAEGAEPNGTYHVVRYEPSSVSGELAMAVAYTYWVPAGVERLRGVIVHQHGCGTGACQGGRTAAYDLHWQALARKWDCALLGPSYDQAESQNCRLWSDPRNGSAKTFLQSLEAAAAQCGHPELSEVPWCLWGHSGGGYWASLMQSLYPERIVAIWFRSGTAYGFWMRGETAEPELTPQVYAIPAMCNPGIREKGDARFDGAWTGTFAMFQAYRAKGAPIGFAPDPRTSHECGDSRYLAIPFFDACLALRLPDPGSTAQSLRPINLADGWLAEPLTSQAVPARAYAGDPQAAVWLPNADVARAWSEYVTNGATSDTTPPPAPAQVTATVLAGKGIELTWQAEADLESGLAGFVIERDGTPIAALPQPAASHFGRPLFQAMSYHDTPTSPLPELRYLDDSPAASAGGSATYRVLTINSVGLKSTPSAATWK
jgi:hypothetical protein